MSHEGYGEDPFRIEVFGDINAQLQRATGQDLPWWMDDVAADSPPANKMLELIDETKSAKTKSAKDEASFRQRVFMQLHLAHRAKMQKRGMDPRVALDFTAAGISRGIVEGKSPYAGADKTRLGQYLVELTSAYHEYYGFD